MITFLPRNKSVHNFALGIRKMEQLKYVSLTWEELTVFNQNIFMFACYWQIGPKPVNITQCFTVLLEAVYNA